MVDWFLFLWKTIPMYHYQHCFYFIQKKFNKGILLLRNKVSDFCLLIFYCMLIILIVSIFYSAWSIVVILFHNQKINTTLSPLIFFSQTLFFKSDFPPNIYDKWVFYVYMKQHMNNDHWIWLFIPVDWMSLFFMKEQNTKNELYPSVLLF